MSGNSSKPAPAKRKARKAPSRSSLEGSSDAKKGASLILEVLCGLRTPTAASEEMGVSLPRYYQLETRALQGMILALEPRPRGRQNTPERAIAQLSKEKARLERDLLRSQALVRAAQRSVGIRVPGPSGRKKKADSENGRGKSKGKRKRKPVARGRKVIDLLREQAASDQDRDEGCAVEEKEAVAVE